MLNCAKAAWELPDGTFKEGKNSSTCLRMKYTVLWRKRENIFMKQLLMRPIAPYSASKADRICW